MKKFLLGLWRLSLALIGMDVESRASRKVGKIFKHANQLTDFADRVGQEVAEIDATISSLEAKAKASTSNENQLRVMAKNWKKNMLDSF